MSNDYQNLPDGIHRDRQGDPSRCIHPSHNPPMQIVIRPGEFLKHTCPGCGLVKIIRGSGLSYS